MPPSNPEPTRTKVRSVFWPVVFDPLTSEASSFFARCFIVIVVLPFIVLGEGLAMINGFLD